MEILHLFNDCTLTRYSMLISHRRHAGEAKSPFSQTVYNKFMSIYISTQIEKHRRIIVHI